MAEIIDITELLGANADEKQIDALIEEAIKVFSSADEELRAHYFRGALLSLKDVYKKAKKYHDAYGELSTDYESLAENYEELSRDFKEATTRFEKVTSKYSKALDSIIDELE